MRLEGIHHITAITADARRNLDFYTGVLGLRLVRSIYFREPSGVLFEIATIGPGFTVDEPLEHLGESLSLPPALAHLRVQLERVLTPLPNVRLARRVS